MGSIQGTSILYYHSSLVILTRITQFQYLVLYYVLLYRKGEFLNVNLSFHSSQLYTMVILARDRSLETDKMNEKELRSLGENNKLYSWCFLLLAIVSASRQDMLFFITQIKVLENRCVIYVLNRYLALIPHSFVCQELYSRIS